MRASCVKLTLTKEDSDVSQSNGTTYGGFLLRNSRYHSGHNASLNFTVGRCGFSSSSIKEEDDLEDGFSELETAAGDGNESDGLVTSETDLSDDGEKEDAEEPRDKVDEAPKAREKLTPRRGRVESELFKEILDVPGITIHSALDKWLEEGNELSREEVSLAMLNLRKRKMFGRALQVIGLNLNLLVHYAL